MLFKKSFGDLVWLRCNQNSSWRLEMEKGQNQDETWKPYHMIDWYTGDLHFGVLDFCALIFRRVVTFAIRVWYGRDLGTDLALIPAYLAIESSKANPNSSWHGHCFGSLIIAATWFCGCIIVDHFDVVHETCRQGVMAWIVCRRVSISRSRDRWRVSKGPNNFRWNVEPSLVESPSNLACHGCLP